MKKEIVRKRKREKKVKSRERKRERGKKSDDYYQKTTDVDF